jgi:hypothetical protein
VQRDPTFSSLAVGVKPPAPVPGTAAAAKLQSSAQAAAARAGRVRSDSADLLVAILNYHRANIAAKRTTLSGWFEQWSTPELDALEALVRSSGEHEPAAIKAASELGEEHPFVKWRIKWVNIYKSDDNIFLAELREVVRLRVEGPKVEARDPLTAERDDLWAEVVLEFERRKQRAGSGSRSGGSGTEATQA